MHAFGTFRFSTEYLIVASVGRYHGSSVGYVGAVGVSDERSRVLTVRPVDAGRLILLDLALSKSMRPYHKVPISTVLTHRQFEVESTEFP